MKKLVLVLVALFAMTAFAEEGKMDTKPADGAAPAKTETKTKKTKKAKKAKKAKKEEAKKEEATK